MKIQSGLFVLLLFSMGDSYCFKKSSIDVSIVGPINYADGLGRIAIGLAECLKDDLSVNHIPCCYTDTNGIPGSVASIVKDTNDTPGNVAFFTSSIRWQDKPFWKSVPQQCFIKIAYSLIESTKIPAYWVEVLNKEFDVVVVADEFYRSVYAQSGVNIPIFVIPHGMYIEHLIEAPLKEKGETFIFGCSGSFNERKNQELLIDAFMQEFTADEPVKLVLQGRDNYEGYGERLVKKAQGAQNIEFVFECLTQDLYEELVSTFDCYVLVSKGEGFSVTPREALALGIPCIIANNTAQKTLCDSGFVCSVRSETQVPSTYPKGLFTEDPCGFQFKCEIDDVRRALREVYTHYEQHKQKALEGRKWVEQYLWKNLKSRFTNLIKPKTFILGMVNRVTNDYLMTNSLKLYSKYLQLLIQKQE